MGVEAVEKSNSSRNFFSPSAGQAALFVLNCRIGVAKKVGADEATALQGGRAKDALLAVADGDTASQYFQTFILPSAGTPPLLRIGEQHDVEQHARWIGGCTGQIVLAARINAGQVKFVINQVIERVPKCAGKQLPFQIKG